MPVTVLNGKQCLQREYSGKRIVDNRKYRADNRIKLKDNLNVSLHERAQVRKNGHDMHVREWGKYD